MHSTTGNTMILLLEISYFHIAFQVLKLARDSVYH